MKMPPKVLLSVTADDISLADKRLKAGEDWMCSYCPVHTAARRAFPELRVSVYRDKIVVCYPRDPMAKVWRHPLAWYRMPRAVKTFIKAFDYGRPVSPIPLFTITRIPLPKEWR